MLLPSCSDSAPAEKKGPNLGEAMELIVDTVEALTEEVQVGKDPDLQAKIRQQAVTPQNIGLRDFDLHIRKDMARLAPLLATIARSN